jgi:hypothetical protein
VPSPMRWAARSRRPGWANGTLMARALRAVILNGVFGLVELRGLEPLTPCLQNPDRLRLTVADLAIRGSEVAQCRLLSVLVVVRLVVSARILPSLR